jgi:hypothetical protein
MSGRQAAKSGNDCNPAAGIFLVFPLLPSPLFALTFHRA